MSFENFSEEDLLASPPRGTTFSVSPQVPSVSSPTLWNHPVNRPSETRPSDNRHSGLSDEFQNLIFSHSDDSNASVNILDIFNDLDKRLQPILNKVDEITKAEFERVFVEIKQYWIGKMSNIIRCNSQEVEISELSDDLEVEELPMKRKHSHSKKILSDDELKRRK